jgi:hypothetical protein
MANEPLRGCPTCGTRVSDLKMGLRDYRWVSDALPGRVAPMDLDCVLERRGHFLVQEFKPKGAPLPMGQRLTLKALVRLGMDVWVVWEDDQDSDRVEVGSMDRNGNVPFVESMRKGRLRRRVADWYTDASKEE